MVFDTKIYVDKDELRVAVKAYLQGNHVEYFNSFDRTGWLAFYEKNISKEVSIHFFVSIDISLLVNMLTQNSFLKILKQFRSTRGTLASRVREGLFSYFGESNLSRITTSDTPSEIAKWKKSAEVAQCYKKLFDNRNNVLAKILEKVFGKNLPPDAHSAYAIAICTTILNPKGEGIQLSEELMKKKFDVYLVSS